MVTRNILIIVCAYNEEANIFRCMDSICHSIRLTKRIKDFKLVVVDNSSTDETLSVACNFDCGEIDCEVISIEHVNLACSRNSYKLFTFGDYIAYVDADGFVNQEWALRLIEMPECDIASGYVNETEPGRNYLWDFFYDGRLHPKPYLIGANMVFARRFLDTVDGFPDLFESRGDESGLMFKVKALELSPVQIFIEDLIAHNSFAKTLRSFVSLQFRDGGRAFLLQRMFSTNSGIFRVFCKPLVAVCLFLLAFLAGAPYGFALVLLGFGFWLLFRRNFLRCSFSTEGYTGCEKFKSLLGVIAGLIAMELGYIACGLCNRRIPEIELFAARSPKIK